MDNANFIKNKLLEKEKLHKIWNLSIWNKLNQAMVRQCDLTWNPIYASILLMYKKLRDLGFEFCDGEIIVNDRDT